MAAWATATSPKPLVPRRAQPRPTRSSVTKMFYDWQDRLGGHKIRRAGDRSRLATAATGFHVDGLADWLVFDPSGEGTGGDTTRGRSHTTRWITWAKYGRVRLRRQRRGDQLQRRRAGRNPTPSLLRSETTYAYDALGGLYQTSSTASIKPPAARRYERPAE